MTNINAFELLERAVQAPHANWERIAGEICPRNSGCPTAQAQRLVQDAAAKGVTLEHNAASHLLDNLRLAGIAATAERELGTAFAIPTRDDASSYPGEDGLRTRADDLSRAQGEAVEFTRNRLRDDLAAFQPKGDLVAGAVVLLRGHVPTLGAARLQQTLGTVVSAQASMLRAGIRQLTKLTA